MCKSACPVSRPRPSLMRDLNHVSSLLRVEKQSWCDKFVIWEAFIRPWNRKIGKTGYQKTLQRPLKGGGDRPHRPPPYGSASGHSPTVYTHSLHFNPLDTKVNYNATSNNTKLVHWPLMGRLLHLVQRGGPGALPLLAVPNVAAHESTASVSITVLQ